MHDIPLFEELAIIAILGAAVTVFLSRFRLPTVAGLLAAGALLGPFGLGLVREPHEIEVLSEVGVVLLLFTIGLEFSFGRIQHIFKQVALGGLVQVGATAAATVGVGLAVGLPLSTSVFFGFVFSLSSTAIVLRALSDRGELDAPHGRFIVGTMIFQDLCVVPMVLLVPVLAMGTTIGVAEDVSWALAKGAVVVLAAWLLARYPVPWLLRRVDQTRSREMFLLSVLAICVGTAWITSLAGLSPALGAFLGGMVVADTEFQHRAMGDIIPLRDAFVSLFFVSLGMLFNGAMVAETPVAVGALFLAFVFGKTLIAVLAAALMRFPPRAAFLAGVGLGQFGEFGFVLLRMGQGYELTDGTTASTVLQAGILSMFVTPILIRLAPHITAGEKLLTPLTRLLGVRGIEQVEPQERPSGHVLIVGYGVAGKMLSASLAACGQEYLVLELNADTVRRARASGVPAYYADATSKEALINAGVTEALAVAIVINDAAAVSRVVDTVRRTAPSVPIIVRTRYLTETQRLIDLGASDVIAEEAEASAETITRLLRRLEIPRNIIEAQVRLARQEMGTSDRKVTLPRLTLGEQSGLADLKVDSVRVDQDWFALGQGIRELNLRRISGTSAIAVKRGNELVQDMGQVGPLQLGDIIFLAGSSNSVRQACRYLRLGESLPPGQGS